MNLAEFPRALGFKNEVSPWSIHFSWSTAEITTWIARKNSLAPTDVRLTLSVNASYWNVALVRRDEKFSVVWRDAGISIDSTELRYRKLVPWPTIVDPLETPQFVPRLGEVLKVSFLPHMNVEGTLADEALSRGFNDSSLRKWMAPSASDWSVFGRKAKTARADTPE